MVLCGRWGRYMALGALRALYGFRAVWALRDSRAWERWRFEGVVSVWACGLWGRWELVGLCGLLGH